MHWKLWPETFHGTNSRCSSSTISRRFYTSWAFPLWLFQRDLHALLAAIIQQLWSVESLRLCATPAPAVFGSLCSDSQLRLLLQSAHSLHGFNNPLPLLGEWEQKLNYWAFINALLVDEFNCTLCRNLLAQIEKQLNLTLSPFHTSVWNMKSHAQHIQSKCITRSNHSWA